MKGDFKLEGFLDVVVNPEVYLEYSEGASLVKGCTVNC